VWLGNIALEEGDTRLAIQEYRKAVQKQPDLGLAYFDLSVALDQEHLFTEADQARNRARALGLSDLPHRFHEVDGLKLAYPDDAPILLDRMTRATPPEKRRFVRGVPIELEPRILTSPWVLAFLSTGLFGALAWWARGRWMWTAQACSKCGKVFCPRCKTTNESRSYCSQCIAVFLTRGAVSIEQQAAKMEQIRRRQKVRTLVRRIGSAIVPGFGDLLAGRPTRGILNGFVGIGALAGALVWAPLFARPLSAWLPIRPVQVMLFVVVVLAWLLSVRRGWGEA
jgi:tetratricopeptide (TPR) repeat protein